jgi:hypothetical protein
VLYFAFFVLVMVATALVVVGELLAVGLLVGGTVHLLRRRPGWYVSKIAKGAGYGAGAGMLCAVALTRPWTGTLDQTLFFLAHLGASGAGYAGLLLAKAYFADRMESAGPPI